MEWDSYFSKETFSISTFSNINVSTVEAQEMTSLPKQGRFRKIFKRPKAYHVRDFVLGMSDGLTVPFALAAGLTSFNNSKVVWLGALAELIAGAISMGIGGFLAAQSDRYGVLY